MKRLAGIGLLTLLAGLAWYIYRLVWGVPLDINHFADRVALRQIQRVPELLTGLGAVDNTILDFHSNRLSDLSPESDAEALKMLREAEAQLRSYDPRRLEGQRRLTYDYLDWTFRRRLELWETPYHFFNALYAGPYPANQTSGVQELPLTTLSQHQNVVDARSGKRYLERMQAIPQFLAGLQSAVAHREELGVLPPRVIVQRLLERTSALLDTPPEKWPIHSVFLQALDSLELDSAERERLAARNRDLMTSAVIPAYREYYAFLESILARAPEAVGLGSQPGGARYYEALLRYYTTTRLSPAQIHALGEERVIELHRQMDESLNRLGFTEGDFSTRLDAFVNSPVAVWEIPAAGADALEVVREQILAEYTRLNEELRAGVADAFRAVPPQPLEVRRVPREDEIGAAGAFYQPPALDGSRPAIFFVNLRDPFETQRFAMRTLAAHEGIPGHHFDSALSQQLVGLPMVRKLDYIAAHSEGWALYAERIAKTDMGMYDNDPLGDLGRLQAEMFRAVRLVVDTGMHAYGWTRQQAIDYMLAETGMTRGEVVSEIDRYIAMPGQACAYMVGMLEILDIREASKARLGARFSLPDFHQAVLGSGGLPLTVLRQEVERQLR